jgi:hypothetical protein
MPSQRKQALSCPLCGIPVDPKQENPTAPIRFLAYLRCWRFYVSKAVGWLVNMSGAPGFVRECDYEGTVCNASIKVRVGPVFTIITVNSLDISFDRLSGRMAGIGFSAECPTRTAGAVLSVAPQGELLARVQE